MKKKLILGSGISGQATQRYFEKRGIPYHTVDRSNEREPLDLSEFDQVVKSPGVPLSHPLAQALPLTSEVELALDELASQNRCLIGITGSNGKTTTALFLEHLLDDGLACGNVGHPLLDQIDKEVDTLIIELSSFQLERLVPSSLFDAVAILNLTPNHLDRHTSFEEYGWAKCQLAACLKEEGKLMDPVALEAFYKAHKEKVESLLKLRYREGELRVFDHDLENYLAAYALSGIRDEELFVEAVTTFQKPPHRLERIAVKDGVAYVNDSKATTVSATIAAVKAQKGSLLMIVGGIDKGGDFGRWVESFRNQVVHVVAIGAAKERIAKELSGVIPVTISQDLCEALKVVATLARRGDTVLLSPGCSSYDQFKSFEERGETFRKYVLGDEI